MNTVNAAQIFEDMLETERQLLNEYKDSKARTGFVNELKANIEALCNVISCIESGAAIEDSMETVCQLKHMVKWNCNFIAKLNGKSEFENFEYFDFYPDKLYNKERLIQKLTLENEALEFAIQNIQ